MQQPARIPDQRQLLGSAMDSCGFLVERLALIILVSEGAFEYELDLISTSRTLKRFMAI